MSARGSRLGPYLLGRGLPDSELGALYEASTRALHELTLLYIELSGALARAEEDEETAAFLARAPRAPRAIARRRALHRGL
ncbi:MAG TPA: protein kinase, partial [Cystobacter sp.]